MFQNVLVPVDLTDAHQRTLEIAAELARAGGGTVTLLHVVEVVAGLSFDEERDFYERLAEAARTHLAGLGKQLDQKQVAWRAEVVFGNRAAEVVRHAAEAKADLIALTSHRVDPQQAGAGWGTLSYKIGILAQCPVLLVK
jgi:universal stress protein A